MEQEQRWETYLMALIKTYNPETKQYEAHKHIVWTTAELHIRLKTLEAKLLKIEALLEKQS